MTPPSGGGDGDDVVGGHDDLLHPARIEAAAAAAAPCADVKKVIGDLTATAPSSSSSSSCTSWASAALDYARLCGRLKRTARTGWVYRNVPDPESVADHSWRVAALCLLLDREDGFGGGRGRPGDEGRGDGARWDGGCGGMDVSKCLEMAVLHDLAEAITGDIAPGDGVAREEKHRREVEAMREISALLGRAMSSTSADSPPSDGAGAVTPGWMGEDDVDDGSGSSGVPPTAPTSTSASRRMLSVLGEYERRETAEAVSVKDLDLLDMIVQADEYERANPGVVDLEEFFEGTPTSRFRDPVVRALAEELHRQRRERRSRACESSSSPSTSNGGLNGEERAATATVAAVEPPSRRGTKGAATCRPPPASGPPHSVRDDDSDAAFCSDFARSSGMSLRDVESVVRALRSSDRERELLPGS